MSRSVIFDFLCCFFLNDLLLFVLLLSVCVFFHGTDELWKTNPTSTTPISTDHAVEGPLPKRRTQLAVQCREGSCWTVGPPTNTCPVTSTAFSTNLFGWLKFSVSTCKKWKKKHFSRCSPNMKTFRLMKSGSYILNNWQIAVIWKEYKHMLCVHIEVVSVCVPHICTTY